MIEMVIFDADGTLTPQRQGSTGPAIFELLPGVTEKLQELHNAEIRTAIASNQSENRSRRDIDFQLEWTAFCLAIPYGMVLYSQTEKTKKPSPWMLEILAKKSNIKACNILFVGDQQTDKEAATNFGCHFEWADYFFNPEKLKKDTELNISS